MRDFPSQRELQLPLLHVLADAGGEATSRSVQDAVAERFTLPDHLRAATAGVGPGKRLNRWDRHVRWAQQRARLAGYTISPTAGVIAVRAINASRVRHRHNSKPC
jgi:hypothetical protein